MNILKNSKGFTLIEIVIVIAIAALILAAVLIFVPQAQNSQRDGHRRSTAAQIVSKAEECRANNGGSNATCLTQANLASYITGITNGVNAQVTITPGACPAAAVDQYRVQANNASSVTVCTLLNNSVPYSATD